MRKRSKILTHVKISRKRLYMFTEIFIFILVVLLGLLGILHLIESARILAAQKQYKDLIEDNDSTLLNYISTPIAIYLDGKCKILPKSIQYEVYPLLTNEICYCGFDAVDLGPHLLFLSKQNEFFRSYQSCAIVQKTCIYVGIIDITLTFLWISFYIILKKSKLKSKKAINPLLIA